MPLDLSTVVSGIGINVADIVTLQKWLLGATDVTLNDWKTSDLCKDDRLDVFDLCLIKRELVKSTYIS